MANNPLRQLPSVNEVLDVESTKVLMQTHAHERVVETVRAELARLRERLVDGQTVDGESHPDAVAARVALRLGREARPKLQRIINATGIVLHTNLGRAPMALEAAEAARQAACGYLNLEMDLDTGKRSSRQSAVREWICRLTGAESATAVNNNAAATVITLRALCQGREVIISRGQLIEIGGSFRIPDIMSVSGAVLREVGTTNITRLDDYDRAITPNTAALMNVHSSNYRIVGFTHGVSVEDLIALGKQRGLSVIDDIGSGALIDFSRFGFSGEPVARDSVAAGADVVLFSGDKLLGGPQAGIIAGRRDIIQRIEKDPLMRAFRLDKMTLAALEATLRVYLNESRALERIPVLRMLDMPLETLKHRAESVAARLNEIDGVHATAHADEAFVGGGSLPAQTMGTWVVEVETPNISDAELAQRLRLGAPAVVARLRDGKLVLDVRTVLEEQETELIVAMQRAVVATS